MKPTPTRVTKGAYTIDMRPKSTRTIKKIEVIFNTWAKTRPLYTAAQFASIPTRFEEL